MGMQRTMGVALRPRVRVVLVTVLAFTSACGDGDDRRASGAMLTLDAASVMAGQATRAVLRDAREGAVDGHGVAWSSSDPAIATVAPSGFVATFAPGVATISAERAGERVATELTVTPLPPRPTGGLVLELSPPAVDATAASGLAVIVDLDAPPAEHLHGPGAVFSLLVQTPTIELLPLRRLGESTRYVTAVSEERLARLLAEPPPAAWRSEHLRYVGDLVVGYPAEGESVTWLGSIVVPVVGVESPVAVTALAPDVQRSAYVVNVRRDDISDDRRLRELLQTFYRHFPDVYTFVAVNAVVAPGALAHFVPVRNRVEGIGEPDAAGISVDAEGPLFDHAAEYGASPTGELLGIVELYENHFDLADQLLSHEIGHAFANHLRGVALADTGGRHFPLSTASFGIMSGVASHATDRVLTPLGDGAFRVEPRTPYGGYNELELYLFGLADRAEVPDQLVFDDPSQDPSTGAVLRGPTTRVTIDDIIAANGPRRPAWTGRTVTFRLATIVVSRGRLLTPAELSYYDAMARRGEATTSFDRGVLTPFTANTGGRGVLRTRLEE